MKWSIAGKGFAAFCMKGFGEAHTQRTDGWVSGSPAMHGEEVRRRAQGKEWGLNLHCVLGALKHFRCLLFNPHQIPDFVR